MRYACSERNVMADSRAFWDSSALIPCLIQQEATTKARQWLHKRSRPVVCWLTVVEINSALARLLHEGALSRNGHNVAIKQLRRLESRWVEVLPTTGLRRLANELLYKYELRTVDALQLASAMVWCNEHPRNRSFITLDPRLANAAAAAEFQVIN
jgi:predicted nucleic acid-binding protein